ncbi:MAG: tetraacyldisaccharide 4'-kinase [candidate division Zixibacteria bacterium]|nr:tetraacyldisaccharide 4'-kinase [candidate division Zixibacteria bacterium]
MKRGWAKALTARGVDRLLWSPLILLLRLATPIYQWFSRRHLARRKAACSALWRATIISVGNITVGGSGKTPIVMYIAQRFIAAGKKVAIVHSGYGRKPSDDVYIEYGHGSEFSVEAIGDEVAMMARRLPSAAFAVGRDKKRITAEADRRYSPDVIILDDGYQRLDIQKNLDIVVINPQVLLERRRLFPGGVLRESVETLGRADAVFVMVGDEPENRAQSETVIRRHNAVVPILHWRMFLDGAESGSKTIGLEQLAGMRPYLFAGLGSFARMYDMVTRAGIRPAGVSEFDDHHEYRQADVERLKRLAARAGADGYLTTAKDLVKLADRAFDKPLYCLHLAVSPDDAAIFDRLIGLG